MAIFLPVRKKKLSKYVLWNHIVTFMFKLDDLKNIYYTYVTGIVFLFIADGGILTVNNYIHFLTSV